MLIGLGIGFVVGLMVGWTWGHHCGWRDVISFFEENGKYELRPKGED